jgi:ubiquinone/menaquinone biosynthesis C-methylase UbiE
MKELPIIGSVDSHDTIRNELAKAKPCKVLDVPAGRGPLSKLMQDLGWEVHSADIDRGNFLIEDIPFSEVNLNRKLPYEDNSFDAIVCANGLHRLFNPGGAISEFSRILKPEGVLYINANNYSSFERRLRYFLYGSIELALNTGACSQTINEPEAHVRIALLFPQIANMLNSTGFEIVKISPAARRWYHYAAIPFAFIIRVASLFAPNKHKKENWLKETNSSAIFPGGRYIYISAKKKNIEN